MISTFRDPIATIRFEAPLARVKQQLQDGQPIFQRLLSRYLVENHHRVAVEMRPDEGMELRSQKEETAKLAKIKENMNRYVGADCCSFHC
jgi:Zn-dependent M16 (insulinase) family peptidase